jgi:uncharacterized protein YraI
VDFMMHVLRAFLCLLLLVPALSLQAAEPAVVRSEVFVRTAPSTANGQVVGTLKPGEEVTVTCSRGWCELADGRGFVATRFLRLGAGDGGGAATPQEETVAVESPPEATPEPAPAVDTRGIIHGVRTARSATGAEEVPLTIQQSGTNALGTMVVGDITTTMAGRINGTQFIFDWENTKAGAVVVAGEGYLNLVGDGMLSGFLLHNGSVLAAMTARR